MGRCNDTTAMRDIASNSAIDFGTGVGVGTDSYSGAGKMQQQLTNWAVL